MKTRRLRPITLTMALLGLIAVTPVSADRNDQPRCGSFDSRFGKDVVKLCSEVRTTVKPRVARSFFEVRFKRNAIPEAARCQATTWVVLLDRQGKEIGESSRRSESCTQNVNSANPSPIKVDQATPTRAYYAAARGCVDLYAHGGTHSVWQKCMQSHKVGFNRN
jgi:hypothetical protein